MLKFYLLFSLLILAVIYIYGCESIISSQSKPDVPLDHTVIIGGFFHKSGERNAVGCADCHGKDLRGGIRTINGRYIFAQSCYQCHGMLWR